jgi:hypothetical protein
MIITIDSGLTWTQLANLDLQGVEQCNLMHQRTTYENIEHYVDCAVYMCHNVMVHRRDCPRTLQSYYYMYMYMHMEM